MKAALVISILLTATGLKAQDSSNCERTFHEFHDRTMLRKTCIVPFSDSLFHFDKSGRLIAWFDYKDYEDGLIKCCYFNLNKFDPLKLTIGFVDVAGKKTGEWKYYKNNDILWDYVVYENGKRIKWIRYGKKGRVIWERNY